MNIMMYSAQHVAHLVERQLGTGFRTEVRLAGKNNGQKLLVSVRKQGDPAAIAFDVLPALTDGEKPESIAEGIARECRETALVIPDISGFSGAMKNEDTGREYILSHVFCQMAGKQGNDHMAGMYLHAEFLDMYVFFRVVVNDSPDYMLNVNDGPDYMPEPVAKSYYKSASCLLTQDMAGHFGLTAETLLEAAGKARHEFRHLFDVLKEMAVPGTPEAEALEIPDGAPEPPLYIISPEDRVQFGADALLDTGVLRRLSDETGGDLVILPSSVHEVLAMPFFAGLAPDELREMVAMINQTEVSPEDRLTDSVYIFRRDTGEVGILE